MNIEEILDVMDELLDRSWSLPLSGGRCVVDAEKIRDLVDEIRLNLPAERDCIGPDRNFIGCQKRSGTNHPESRRTGPAFGSSGGNYKSGPGKGF